MFIDKTHIKSILFVVFGLLLLLVTTASFAGAETKVGTGDEGGDLEKLTPLVDGPIYEARKKAVSLLNKFNVNAIAGLGMLIPEISHNQIYMAEQNVQAIMDRDQGKFHSNMNGLVYARTFPRPHAATRFFPIANSLNEKQLVALYIHEGLHRALPKSINENEAIVSELTLAIVAVDTSYDQIKEVASKLIPFHHPVAKATETVAEHYKKPSSLGYRIQQFHGAKESANYPIKRMHIIQSHLYPFGGVNLPIGMGVGFSFIEIPGGGQMGPLDLSLRGRVWTYRKFDVRLFGMASLNTLSDEELKNSSFGRDVYTLGISMNIKGDIFYAENSYSINPGGTANETIGNVFYGYDYGNVINVKVRGGVRFSGFDLGGFIQVNLADYLRINRGTLPQYDTGRYRIVSIGPEFTYGTEDYSISLLGRFLLDSTKDTSFDELGHLMGFGVSEGSVGASVKVYF